MLDLNILESFKNNLIEARNSLLSYNIEIINKGINEAVKYYDYLRKCKVAYGNMAYKVVKCEDFEGQMASIHFHRQSVFDGTNAKSIPEIKNKIIIRLAAHDVSLRINNDITYSQIAEYHLSEFKEEDILGYSWGGLFFELLVGPGTWMLFNENNKMQILKNLEFKCPDEYKENYSVARLYAGIKDTMSVYLYQFNFLKNFPMLNNINPQDFTIEVDSKLTKKQLAKKYDVDVVQIIQCPKQLYFKQDEINYIIYGKNNIPNSSEDLSFMDSIIAESEKIMQDIISPINLSKLNLSYEKDSAAIEVVRETITNCYSQKLKDEIKTLIPDLEHYIPGFATLPQHLFNVCGENNEEEIYNNFKCFTNLGENFVQSNVNIVGELKEDDNETESLIN